MFRAGNKARKLHKTMKKKHLRQASARSAFSIAEVIMAIGFFVILFTLAMRGFVETNLPAQGMIRDYAIAMNLCEKLMTLTENRIKSGDIPPVGTSDITLELLDNPDFVADFSRFAGGIQNTHGQLKVNFAVNLTVEPVDQSDVFAVVVDLTWTDGNVEKRSFDLKSYISREKSLTTG